MMEILRPRASALIESMRDIGYSLEAAVADIVDNSITAKAKHIDIQFGWRGEAPWMAIVDDGNGMDAPGLVGAMRLGSRDPLDPREAGDLGRFGLGLKTASFSQCRRLTVLSSKDGVRHARRWDLDLVRERDEWILTTPLEDDLERLSGAEGLGPDGTCVVWEMLDRLDLGEDPTEARQRMNARIDGIRDHLALVFHRFLVDDHGRRRLRIRINAREVEAFDPFNSGCPGTTHLPEETFLVEGEHVRMQPFILPHHSKVASREYERYAGRDGYLRGQGFYIYRNRRLIIHGTWFRMARQEQLTKLARVRVDIPNNLDHLWTIDVRKSRAHPPEVVSRRMSKLVDNIRESSKRPYLHRGRVIQQRVGSPVWRRRVFNDRVDFEIDREHPLIAEFRADLDPQTQEAFDNLLQMVGSTFPKALVFNDLAERPKETDRPLDQDLLRKLAGLMAAAHPGAGPEELREKLLETDPFMSDPDFVNTFITDRFGRGSQA